MSKTLRWVFTLLPCAPGLTLGLAGVAMLTATRDERAWQLLAAGGAVLLAGLGIGGIVAWRIAHPRPEPVEEDAPTLPPVD